MKKRNNRSVKKINLKKIILFVFFIILTCLIIHPIQLLNGNLFKPMSIAVESNNVIESKDGRYFQNKVDSYTYADAAGKEYSVQFLRKSTSEETQLISYENLLIHRSATNLKTSDGKTIYLKDLLIADMYKADLLTNENYKLRYLNKFSEIYRENNTEKINLMINNAKNDSTINQEELTGSYNNLWNELGLSSGSAENYFAIHDEERVLYKKGYNPFGNVGTVVTTTRSLALYSTYNNSKKLTVGNGITAGEAYLMASTRIDSDNVDVDKIQQGLWKIQNNIEEIPNVYRGINPQAGIEGEDSYYEARTLDTYLNNLKEFQNRKDNPNQQEIIDNMLANGDKYADGTAGLVSYDEKSKEFVVGPFSIDYLRYVYKPIDGGQNQTQNGEGIVVLNCIEDSEVYGVNKNGEEVKLNDWEFVYTNVNYDAKTKTAQRVAEKEAYNNGDLTPNTYPYPNELFYIKFTDSSVEAITKLEFTLSSMNAEAEVSLLQGKYYNISWKSAIDTQTNVSFLQMSPTWDEIKSGKVRGFDAPNIYQINSARIIKEKKVIQLAVGNKHVGNEYIKYNNGNEIYCIPITMEMGGNVWYDGAEVLENDVDGIKKDDEKGIEGVNVYLYDENNNKVASTVTNKDGNYLFTYIKLGQKYYIEFEYDGMIYKATKYLNSASFDGYRDNFMTCLNLSHAKEVEQERIDFNNQFTEIKNGDSRNNGQAISNDGNLINIEYQNQNSSKGADYIGSKAFINRYNFSARTSYTDIYYPLQNSYIITNNNIQDVDFNQKDLDKRGLENIFVLGTFNQPTQEYYVVNTKQGEKNNDVKLEENFTTHKTVLYTMVDTYLHHINLGLVERTPIDLAIKSDLVQTQISLEEEVSEPNILNFGKKADYYDIENRQNTDKSNYFKEYYSQDIEYRDYTWQHDFVNNPQSIENDNTQLYIQYKMTVKNQSDVVSGYVTELVNYYEDDLYYPVDSNETWKYYDKEKNYIMDSAYNEKGYANIVIPQLMTYSSWAIKNNIDDDGNKYDSQLGQIEWYTNSKFGKENNKKVNGLNTMYTSSLKDEKLKAGESIDIYVIYKVEVKPNPEYGKNGELYLSTKADKRNIIEINSYKPLNKDGTNGGRLDKDSAPGNSEIDNFITYEDDIDVAPLFNINVKDKNITKSISGHVWRDETESIKYGDYSADLGILQANNQRVGNGKIDVNYFSSNGSSFEEYANDVKVELIRLEYDKILDEYVQVEFTDKYIEAYQENGELIKDNLYSIVDYTNSRKENGKYSFDNLIETGKYKVRFTYGTEKELREEFSNSYYTVFNGQDYKSTEYNGRIDASKIENPSTEIVFVIDSYDLIDKMPSYRENALKNPIAILDTMKNLMNDLALINKNIKFKIFDYGAWSMSEPNSINDIGTADIKGKITLTASNAIAAANNYLIEEKDYSNKIMIIYNDGYDSQVTAVQENIALALENGIKVVGLGYGNESLELFKTKGNSDFKIYTLNDEIENNKNIKNKIYDFVLDKIIQDNYFTSKENNIEGTPISISHAEDYLQNSEYYTMAGNLVKVTGRLDVMKYSQEMDPIVAESLNVDQIRQLEIDKADGTPWSNAIKELATNTQMTADSYIVSFNFNDDSLETKELNLGLQEIPKRTVEITNEVDNISIKLANGRKIIDWPNLSQNVQEIPDKLFNIYMDEEIIQGATVEVTYRINVSNIGDVDSLYSYVKYATDAEKKQWYKALTGEDIPEEISIDEYLLKTEPIKISKLYNYYDNLIFRAEDNNRWEIINKTVEKDGDTLNVKRDEFGNLIYLDEERVYDYRGNIRKERVVWTKVNSGDVEVLERVRKANVENFDNLSVVETTSLKDIKLYPNKSKEVIDNLTSNNVERPVSTLCTYITLSKTLSAENMNEKDTLNYRNYTEIIKTSSNTGRRDYNGAEGNFNGDLTTVNSENDIDNAERVTILPPFGKKKILIGVIILQLIVIAAGIIFIKKKNFKK